MFPNDELLPDWIFCISSNVHVCRDRAWFIEYTPFSTYVSCGRSSPDLGVIGIGTVLVPVEPYPGATAIGYLRLVSVLHAPSVEYNIIGGMAVIQNGGRFSLGGADSRGGLNDASGRQVAYFANDSFHPRLLAVKLWGPWPPSRIRTHNNPPTAVHWTAQECERWSQLSERLRLVAQPPATGTKRKASTAHETDPCGVEDRRQCKRQMLRGVYRVNQHPKFSEGNIWNTRQPMAWDVMVD